MKNILLKSLTLIFLSSILSAEEISGFWETIDKKSKKPTSVIAVYAYEGKYYARIIGSYNQEGVLDDTIYQPKGRAPGIEGHPYYAGLDIVWDAKLDDEGDRYKGYVVDPRSGKVYHAQLWKKDNNLVLRGKEFIFGRSVVWPPFPEEKFNSSFKKPDLSAFIPAIPQARK